MLGRLRSGRCLIGSLIALFVVLVVLLWRNNERSYYPTINEGQQAKFNSRELHVVTVFDKNRMTFAVGMLRSLAYYSDPMKELHVHVITQPDLYEKVEDRLPTRLHSVTFYDFDVCHKLVAPVLAFSDPSIHVAAHCKMFLADILHGVDSVLYLDNDIVVTQDFAQSGRCTPSWKGEELIGMVYDMGDVCQINPEKCWPMGFERVVPAGQVCGNLKEYSSAREKQGEIQYCAMEGDVEPVVFNGGVLWMNLKGQRSSKFTERYINVTVATAQKFNVEPSRRAQWGEQSFINNFFRYYPQSLAKLPCGCNYQFKGSRRHATCGNQPVYVAHLWRYGAQDSNHHYTKLFTFFQEQSSPDMKPPWVPLWSGLHPRSGSTLLTYREATRCFQPSVDCRDIDYGFKTLYHQDAVNVLTRTSHRRKFFGQAKQSVDIQTHPRVNHLVLTDDPGSAIYVKEYGLEPTLVESLYEKFDPFEPCQRCGASRKDNCAKAPGLTEVVNRGAFLECFCETQYPMNGYMNELHKRVKDGWIIYLDDDNLLWDKYVLSAALAAATSEDVMVMWQSHLGRPTPSPKNFGKPYVVRGDCDASNFLFHSKHIEHTAWNNFRCGDYRTLSSLANHLELRWINRTVVGANPQRAALGGLGMRGEGGNGAKESTNQKKNQGEAEEEKGAINEQDTSQSSKITVVIPVHKANAMTVKFLQYTVSQYVSHEFESAIDRIVIPWKVQPGQEPPEFDAMNVVVISAESALLKEATRYIRTNTVLLLSAEYFLTSEGLTCLTSWWSQTRSARSMIGPFVRQTRDSRFIENELWGGQPYWIVLSRVLMLDTSDLKNAVEKMSDQTLQQAEANDGFCEDIMLNLMVQSHEFRRPPLRTQLPARSVVDYSESCSLDPYLDQGPDFNVQRGWCVTQGRRMAQDFPVLWSKKVAICSDSGAKMGSTHAPDSEKLKSMTTEISCDLINQM